jgi:hypothetical protein
MKYIFLKKEKRKEKNTHTHTKRTLKWKPRMEVLEAMTTFGGVTFLVSLVFAGCTASRLRPNGPMKERHSPLQR